MSEKTTATRAKEVRDNVYSILENFPETRNDDRLLMLRYWSQVDEIQYDHLFPLQFATKSTSPESITRARRSIQAAGTFLPTEQDVLDRRRIRQEELRQHYASK